MIIKTITKTSIVVVLLSLSQLASCSDPHTFFIGTGPLSQEILDEVEEYDDLTGHLNTKFELKKTVTHFKLNEGYVGDKRIVVEVVNRKATYIYVYYTKGRSKPSFEAIMGNNLFIYGFTAGDEKGGLLMERNNYVDISNIDGEG